MKVWWVKTNSANNFGSVITWARDMIFFTKKISDLLLTRQSNICRKKQIFVFNIMLIVWASLFFNHLCGGQRVSFGGNSVSRHTEKVENTHLLGPGVKFFSSSNARKNFSSKITTLPIPAPDLSWVAYLGLCIFCILPIQTFTFHFPKTNSDPLSRWPVSLWYRNNDVSPGFGTARGCDVNGLLNLWKLLFDTC